VGYAVLQKMNFKICNGIHLPLLFTGGTGASGFDSCDILFSGGKHALGKITHRSLTADIQT
jgi:hypothetical protein